MQLCHALGVLNSRAHDYEADDIVGTLATRMRAAGRKVIIVTRDKDLAQLMRPGDEYWDYSTASAMRTAISRNGSACSPSGWRVFSRLTGDAVDNIPGVPGVGRKTASLLFRHFESLAHLYDDLDVCSSSGCAMPDSSVASCVTIASPRSSRVSLTGIACDVPMEASTWAHRAPAAGYSTRSMISMTR